jgi:hypothetical protein
MEMFAILFAGCFGLVAAPVYCFVVARFVRPHRVLNPFGFWGSVTAIAAFSVELLLVSSHGVIGTRELVGIRFFSVHCLLTIAAAPALGCIFLLGRPRFPWPVVAVVCWVAGIAALLYQFHVGETLYGIDGVGGPYVSPD